MTKTIKLSLAAVMAAGIATTATAANLEDAIKGVEVSGYVDYRLENKTVEKDSSKSFDVNEYGINVTLTSKVNDMVKATVSAGFDEVQTDNANSDESGAIDQDATPGLTVDQAKFTFDLGATTVIAGKQAIPSVFVDKVDTAKTGAGVVALHTVNDSLTVAAAHFMNNNITNVYGLGVAAATDTKTTELLAIAKAGMVNIEAHYNMTDVSHVDGGVEADHMYLKLDTDVAGVKLVGKYASASADSKTVKWADSSVMQLAASTKVGAIGVKAGFATADKAKGTNNFQTDVALDGDNDAEAHFKVWQLSTSAIKNEGTAMMIGADMAAMDKVTVGATYAIATDDGVAAAKDTDYSELLLTATYKMSKNFTIHGRYSMLNKDTNLPNGSTDTDYSRIQVKYTF